MADVDEHYLIHNLDNGAKSSIGSFDRKTQHSAQAPIPPDQPSEDYDSESDMATGFDSENEADGAEDREDRKVDGVAKSSSKQQAQRRASGRGIFSTITSLISKGKSHFFSNHQGTNESSTVPAIKTPIKCCKEDFTMLRVIGKGSFAKVILVRKKDTDQLYAMKVLSKPAVVKRKQVEHTRTERRVLEVVGHLHNHPYISEMHFAFQTDSKLYLVLHYCAGGELFHHLQRMKRIPERWARLYAAELVLALSHLHSHGVAYRDLKPENVLLDEDGHVKICDFGLSKDNVSEPTAGASSLCGTPEYLAPEVLDRRGHGTCVDWWGLGMVLYELLTGLPPWYTTDRKKLFARIRTAPLKFPSFAANNMSPEARGFITQLLNRDPLARLGGDGNVQAIKKHPFFTPACGMLATSAGHPAMDWAALMRREIASAFRPDSMVASEPQRYTHDQRAYISKDPERFRDHTHEPVYKCVGGSSPGKSGKKGIDPAELARNFDPEHARLPFDSEVGQGSMFGSGGLVASPDVEFTGFTFDEGASPHLSLEEDGKTLSSVFKEAKEREREQKAASKGKQPLGKRLNFNNSNGSKISTSSSTSASNNSGSDSKAPEEAAMEGMVEGVSDLEIEQSGPVSSVVNMQPGATSSAPIGIF